MRAKIGIFFLFVVSTVCLQAQKLPHSDSVARRMINKPFLFNETLKPFLMPFSFNKPSDNSDFKSYILEFPATWGAFKRNFLSLPLPEEFAMMERFLRNMELGKNYQYNSIWFDSEEHIENWNRMRRPCGVGLSTSIFQELYDEYSHEGKMKRKYDSILKHDDIERQIYPKYNTDIVKQIAGFSDDSTTYAFMRFCDFKNDSLLQANNYDVYLMIQDCLSQFLLLENHGK